MDIEIVGRPEFYVPFTKDQCAVLIKLSEVHYDYLCKMYSREGGFLYGLRNFLQYSADGAMYQCSWKNLDVLMKIMEMAADPYLNHQEMSLVSDMKRDFHRAMTSARHECLAWTTISKE